MDPSNGGHLSKTSRQFPLNHDEMGERVVNVVVSQYVGVLTIINPCKLVGFMSPKHDYNLLANHKQY